MSVLYIETKIKLIILIMCAFLLGCSSTSTTTNKRKSSGNAAAEKGPDRPSNTENDNNPAQGDGGNNGVDVIVEEVSVDTDDDEISDDTPIQEIPANIGVRNFDQILFSMASLTGVDRSAPRIRTAFADVKAQLPANHNIREISPAKISAITKLGAYFCDELVQDDARRAAIFPGFDFSQNPAQALAAPEDLVRTMMDAFWGKDLGDNPQQADTMPAMTALIGQMVVDKPNTPETTRNVVMGACTAILSSAPILIY